LRTTGDSSDETKSARQKASRFAREKGNLMTLNVIQGLLHLGLAIVYFFRAISGAD